MTYDTLSESFENSKIFNVVIVLAFLQYKIWTQLVLCMYWCAVLFKIGSQFSRLFYMREKSI